MSTCKRGRRWTPSAGSFTAPWQVPGLELEEERNGMAGQSLFTGGRRALRQEKQQFIGWLRE